MQSNEVKQPKYVERLKRISGSSMSQMNSGLREFASMCEKAAWAMESLKDALSRRTQSRLSNSTSTK